MFPTWQNFFKDKLNDGKFNADLVPPKFSATNDFWPPLFPGYIDNNTHPFTYCDALYDKGDADKTKWCLGESPSQFESNKEKMPPDWKYRTKEVEYKVNTSGYRTKEWSDIDWKNSVVIFGDSCTFGSGIAEDETISSVLESNLSRPVINMGVPGGSNQLILNNCATLIEKFGIPYGVVINWTTTDRFRYYFKNGYHDVGPWDDIDKERIDGVDVTDLWTKTYMDQYNELCSAYFISKIAKSMWEGRTKYITISYFDYVAHYTRANKFFKIINTARDLLHPGYENSLEIAEYLKCKLQE